MACNRGAANPTAATKLRLFSASAGVCQNPKCLDSLFRNPGGKDIHIGELAHIFAAQDGGPRSNSKLTKEERGLFENIILLCASCHTEIDKAPEVYTDAVVSGWKREHQHKLDEAFGSVELPDRPSVRRAIEPLLEQNRAIFDLYGPHIEASQDPESDAPATWRAKILETTLPNSYRMLNILRKNRAHLTEPELRTVSLFQEHVDDLERRHLTDAPAGTRFPDAMNTLLLD